MVKYNSPLFFFLCVVSISCSHNATFDSTYTSEYSYTRIDIHVSQHQSSQNLNVEVILPNGYETEHLECECQKINNLILFQATTSQVISISWKGKNPKQSGKYKIKIIVYHQNTTLNQEEIIVNIIPKKLKIAQTVGVSSFNMSISPSNYIVGALTNYKVTLSSAQTIPKNTGFLLLFPAWAPGLQFKIRNSNNCTTQSSSAGISCIWQTIGNQSILNFQQLFPQEWQANKSLVIYLNNFINPSSTQPYIINGYLGDKQYSATIQVNIPATSNVSISAASNTTGIQYLTTVSFIGRIYVSNNTFMIVSYTSFPLVSYNGSTNNTSFQFGSLSSSSMSPVLLNFNFSITNPQYQTNASLTMTTFYKNINGAQQYYIESGTYSQQFQASAIKTSFGKIYLYTIQTIKLSITLPFKINVSSYLRLQFDNNSTSKLNCANCTNNNINYTVPPNQTQISLDLQFRFQYFDNFNYKANLYLDVDQTQLSAKENLSVSSFCGVTCQSCNQNNASLCYKCWNQSLAKTTYYYYQNQQKCVLVCPDATYNDSVSKTCVPCGFQCEKCDSNGCITCKDRFTKAENGTCISNCGLKKFNNSGNCQSCPQDCNICLNSSYCVECSNSTQLTFNNLCKQNCYGNCRTCDSTGYKCTSCLTGYLYNFECYDECPVGTILVLSRCQQFSGLITFPFLITLVLLCVGLGSTKFFWRKTDITGLFVMISGLCEVACALATTRILLLDSSMFRRSYIVLGIGLISYIVSNLGFILLYVIRFRKDAAFIDWSNEFKNNVTKYVILALSGIYSFKFFRSIYSRFLYLQIFSSRFTETKPIIPLTNMISGINFLTFSCLMLVGAILALVQSPTSYKGSQGYYFCIELIVIQLLVFIFLVLDCRKPDDFFEQQLQQTRLEANYNTGIQGTLQNIQTNQNEQVKIQTIKNKSPGKKGVQSKYQNQNYRSPILKKDAPSLPSMTMPSGFQSKLSLDKKNGKSKDTSNDKKLKAKADKKDQQQNQIRRGNRFTHKKRVYDTGSNQSFDIYLDFDHEPKSIDKQKNEIKKRKNNFNSKSSQIKNSTKSKLTPMNDIYIGFMNTQSDQLNNSVQVQKKQKKQKKVPTPLQTVIDPIQIRIEQKKEQQPQIVINLQKESQKLKQKNTEKAQQIKQQSQKRSRVQKVQKKDKEQQKVLQEVSKIVKLQNSQEAGDTSLIKLYDQVQQQAAKQSQVKIQKQPIFSKTQGFQNN